MADSLRAWDIETEDGWETFRPGVAFEGRHGEAIQFKRGSFEYRVTFLTDTSGLQENLRTGRRRRLRRVLGTHASLPSSAALSISDSEWCKNLKMLRQQLLLEHPQILEQDHPAHAMLLRAQAAERDGRWEAAFNELFMAQEAVAGTVRGNGPQASSQNTLASSPHCDAGSTGVKRSASSSLCEAMGVSRKVARRLLNDTGGDPSLAAGRALMIQDLEQGQNSQLKTNDKPEECSICIETLGRGEAVMLLPCKHGWYCFDCLRRAADAKIANGATLGAICCPVCDRELSEFLLRALLGTDQMEKLHRQSLEAAVAASSELRPCPTPDCPNRVALEDGMTPRLRCEMCGKDSCLLCSASPYHVGKSCQEKLAEAKGQSSERSLREWMARVGAKQCPKCQMVVTKQNISNQATQASECHKMICRSCRTRFCFRCLAILTESSTCGCTPDNHGFIDPDTGAFVQHLGPVRRRRQR